MVQASGVQQSLGEENGQLTADARLAFRNADGGMMGLGHLRGKNCVVRDRAKERRAFKLNRGRAKSARRKQTENRQKNEIFTRKSIGKKSKKEEETKGKTEIKNTSSQQLPVCAFLCLCFSVVELPLDSLLAVIWGGFCDTLLCVFECVLYYYNNVLKFLIICWRSVCVLFVHFS